jgi:hypothetical protein
VSSVSIKDARMKADGPRLDGAATSATWIITLRRLRIFSAVGFRPVLLGAGPSGLENGTPFLP